MLEKYRFYKFHLRMSEIVLFSMYVYSLSHEFYIMKGMILFLIFCFLLYFHRLNSNMLGYCDGINDINRVLKDIQDGNVDK